MCTYYNGHPRFLKLLIQHLCADVNAREPASIARVTVIPTQGILKTTNLYIHANMHTILHTRTLLAMHSMLGTNLIGGR